MEHGRHVNIGRDHLFSPPSCCITYSSLKFSAFYFHSILCFVVTVATSQQVPVNHAMRGCSGCTSASKSLPVVFGAEQQQRNGCPGNGMPDASCCERILSATHTRPSPTPVSPTSSHTDSSLFRPTNTLSLSEMQVPLLAERNAVEKQ